MVISIFDLDGTLIDSLPAHIKFYTDFGKRHGVLITESIVRKAVYGLTTSFYQNLGVPSVLFATLNQEYAADFEHYDCPLFPGTKEFLDSLKSKDLTLCLATSNRKKNVQRFGTEILRFFDYVKTQEDGFPKHLALRAILNSTGKPVLEHRLIGDSLWDRLDAEHCKIPFVGVSWGWQRLRQNKYFPVAQSYSELLEMLTKGP
jgi:phosphoglycolate phosphatase-like HAD superfamily hydrolase